MGLMPNPFAREDLVLWEPIPGVRLIRLLSAEDARGAVTKLWELEGPPVAEVYLSSVNPGAVKGWHTHSRMTLRYVCVSGAVLVGLSNGVETARFVLSDGQPPFSSFRQALIIRPGIANGFRAMEGATRPAVILNLADAVHDPGEIERTPLPMIEFDWGPYGVSG